MSKKHYTPNDHRSIAKNPNSSAYVADQRNQAQLRQEVRAPSTTPRPEGAKQK